MTFANPGYLFLLLLLLPVIGWYIYELHKSDASVQVSDTASLAKQPKSLRIWLLHVPFVLRVAVITLLSFALARPQLTNRWSSESTEGIDIMMALDISGTMLAEDLKPNRLEAAKQVASDFVIARPNDQIGLVVFAGESFTQCPLTTDHAVLINLFKSVEYGMIEDGTAIGMGLANAVSRLKESKAKSKVVILLTDGSNNRGDISPMTAAEIAKSLGIRVYTIGVGTNKVAPYPMPVAGGVQYVNIPVEIDTKTLSEIAAATEGDFYRATNTKELRNIYKEIDQLEKSKLNVKKFSKRYEAYQPFALAAIIALLLELLLRITIFRRIP